MLIGTEPQVLAHQSYNRVASMPLEHEVWSDDSVTHDGAEIEEKESEPLPDRVQDALFRDETPSPQKQRKRSAARFLGDGQDPEDLFADLDEFPTVLTADKPIPTEPAPKDLGVDIDTLWNDGAGVDGVAVKKPRVPTVLKEERLLGEMGLPNLRQRLQKFKCKGRGHEQQDLLRLMTLYQLWAHQMFPKGTLRDTLQATEKLSHKRSVQRAFRTMREEEREKSTKKEVDIEVDPWLEEEMN